MQKHYTKVWLSHCIALILLAFNFNAKAQTASNPWQAQYGTGGLSTHVNEVCWLTWGAVNSTISNGTYYWNLTPTIKAKATISNISSSNGYNNPLIAYASGSYTADGLQKLYSGINPIGIEGVNSGDEVSFDISIQLLINGNAVDYPGMVIGDAESMAVGEYMSATTGGTGWQVLDYRQADTANASDYQLIVSNAKKTFKIQTVNHSNLGKQAVMFAQGVKSLTNVKLKGQGLTSLAIGFIVPFDFGDAPAAYGNSGHYINGFTATGTTVTNGTYSVADIVKSDLIPTANVYMGAANVDADANPPAGPLANYDDTSDNGDEDGVTFTSGALKINQSGNYTVTVNATNKNTTKDANIYGWIDFNGDGVFSSNEIATATVPANTTSPVNRTLTYNLNNFKYAAGSFKAGTTYARFRITTDALANSNTTAGTVDQRSITAAADGEAEDYKVDITAMTIKGTVYDDANGMTDNTVNGTGIGKLGTDQLYAYLSYNGTIIDKVAVATDGTYAFITANPSTNYIVAVTKDNSKNVNDALSALNMNLTSGWVNTGSTYGTPNLAGTGNTAAPYNGQVAVSISSDNTNITGVNFGMDKIPVVNNMTFNIPTPAPHSTKTLTATNSMGAITGTDAEDGTLSTNKTIKIISVTGTNGNAIYYNGNPVTAGAAISNYDPTLLTVKFDSTTALSMKFTFAVVDAAGQASAPATYTVNWASPLPLTLIAFNAAKEGNNIMISWTTANEVNMAYFTTEHSTDAKNWTSVAETATTGKGADKYELTDTHPGAANNYYRLKMVNVDGTFAYSPVRMVNFDGTVATSVSVYPNPAIDKVNVSAGAAAITKLAVLDINGRVMAVNTGDNIQEVNLNNIPAGQYILQVMTADNTMSFVKIIKQ